MEEGIFLGADFQTNLSREGPASLYTTSTIINQGIKQGQQGPGSTRYHAPAMQCSAVSCRALITVLELIGLLLGHP